MGDPLALATEIQAQLLAVGPWAPVLLGTAALLEYLLPPFPGDTVTLVGGVMAASGSVPWSGVVLALFAGNTLGIVIDWRVGCWLARNRDRLPSEAQVRPWWQPLTRERFEGFEIAYRRWGAWLLVVNRFLPAARAFFFLAAGAAGLSLRETLGWGLLSAAMWSALVLSLGVFLGGKLPEVIALVGALGTGGWMALGAAGLVWLAWRCFRRRR